LNERYNNLPQRSFRLAIHLKQSSKALTQGMNNIEQIIKWWQSEYNNEHTPNSTYVNSDVYIAYSVNNLLLLITKHTS